MGWKRDFIEGFVRLRALFAPASECVPDAPRSIFVLRNNGIGDVLLVTPLLAALRQRYPSAKIVAGVGSWAMEVLQGNPDVDAVMRVNAPWGNHNAPPKSFSAVARYLRSKEAQRIAAEKFDVGIDVMGSWQGSLLLMRAGIPWRLGVRGYAGGHTAAQACIDFHPQEQVAAMSLRFAALLGAKQLPEPRPRLFLDPEPHNAIVLAPGAGYAAKCWPLDHFEELVKKLAPRRVMVIGSQNDAPLGAALRACGAHVDDRTGKLSLRETFCAIGGASLVLCNTSMAMHAAAAFKVPCVTLLGAEFPSAQEHAIQWGHPETRVLGREPEHDQITRPEEAFEFLISEGLLK